MSDTPKIKGVADIVVLLDVSGSMQDCIGAVKSSISTFVSSLTSKDANNENPIKDWRLKVCGYRDHQVDGDSWFVDNPFVRDIASIQAQLEGDSMQASGGGDEPESLLDALVKLARMGQPEAQEPESPDRWRVRGTATRVIIFFTDATFKAPMTIPEAMGGGVTDVITALTTSRVLLCGFVPDWDGYAELATIDRAEFDFIATRADVPALCGLGKPGAEGQAAMTASVAALRAKAADSSAFQKIMAQLARTVSKSNVVEAA